MPEGDTIHRVADRLRPALAGQPLERFEAPRAVGPRPALGSAITVVEAKGKHLLIHFSDGVTLHTHLRMTGTWHLYRSGSRWRLPGHLARAVVGVADWEAVCFKAPVVDLYRQPPAHLPQPLDHLGPDLCLEDPPVDEVVARMAARADADSEIAPLLLDQQVAAGIGNVFKSEVLWACRVSPFARVHDLDVETRHRLVTVAARQLRANVSSPGERSTLSGGGLAVYGRFGQPCPRCGTPVQRRSQGEDPRVTYWCPRCQP
ncbi:MAG TPA: DNA-formamidopyrimidine glycosylase family protein [Acidimicrobiales bacterium]